MINANKSRLAFLVLAAGLGCTMDPAPPLYGQDPRYLEGQPCGVPEQIVTSTACDGRCRESQSRCVGTAWQCISPGPGAPCNPLPVAPLDAGTPTLDGGSSDASVVADASVAPTDVVVVPSDVPRALGAPCYNGVGACARMFTYTLAANGRTFQCVGAPGMPVAETCNGIDDDCNGAVDDGANCRCTLGASRPCYGGSMDSDQVGLCRPGLQTCVVGSMGGSDWGLCVGDVRPRSEVCTNGTDDNCDGTTDEQPCAR